MLPIAKGYAKKQALHDKLALSQAEGIVFKDAKAPYKPGRPASGGTQRKHKFVKTADVVLVSNAGNAYQMAVFEGKRTARRRREADGGGALPLRHRRRPALSAGVRAAQRRQDGGGVSALTAKEDEPRGRRRMNRSGHFVRSALRSSVRRDRAGVHGGPLGQGL